MSLKLVFALFFSFTILHIQAQILLQGEVKSTTDNIIPGASVEYLHYKIGCMADGSGKFKIQKIAGDTLQISSVGYVTGLFPVQEETSFLQAILTEDTKVLKEVTVSTKKMKTVSLGYYTSHDQSFNSLWYNIEYGVLIPNKYQVEGYIKEIKFRLARYENAPYNLRVRLRAIDTLTGLPSDSLLYLVKDIPPAQLQKVNKIDLNNRYLILPPEGIVATLEWVRIDSTERNPLHTPFITGRRIAGARSVYQKGKAKNMVDYMWFYYTRDVSTDGKELYAPNISILVSVPKN